MRCDQRTALPRPALFFGDETSFALAHSLRFTPQGSTNVRLLFEVTSLAAAQNVLDRLGINADLIERTAHDAHLGAVETLAATEMSTHALKSCVLTGKASSILRLHKHLKAAGMPSRQFRTRAYWAPGKVGLD